MPFFSESDIDTMLQDLGVPVVHGADSTYGIMDRGTDLVLEAIGGGAQAPSVVVSVKTGTLPGLAIGDQIDVSGTTYVVTGILVFGDGAVTRLRSKVLSAGAGDTILFGDMVVPTA